MMFFINEWFILAVLLVVCELFSQGLYLFLAFSIGCLPAAVAQFYMFSLEAQIGFFVTGALIAFCILSQISQKNVKGEDYYKSAVDALPGKHGMIIETIPGDMSFGMVKLKDGQEWSAQSVNGSIILVKTEVVVVRVEGVRLIVAPLKS